jgi:hypothetical protein
MFLSFPRAGKKPGGRYSPGLLLARGRMPLPHSNLWKNPRGSAASAVRIFQSLERNRAGWLRSPCLYPVDPVNPVKNLPASPGLHLPRCSLSENLRNPRHPRSEFSNPRKETGRLFPIRAPVRRPFPFQILEKVK